MQNYEKIVEAVKLLLDGIGEDIGREGLAETPHRVARLYGEILCGQEEDAAIHLSKVFPVEYNEIVVEKDIEFHSVCEHHLMPFFGKAHVAYVPNGKVAGLSKLARTVEVYARRLQIQEQMTGQIADALMEHLTPQGAMVMVEAEHMCMTMRGVKKSGSKTVSVAVRGIFQDNLALQNQFFRTVQNERF